MKTAQVIQLDQYRHLPQVQSLPKERPAIIEGLREALPPDDSTPLADQLLVVLRTLLDDFDYQANRHSNRAEACRLLHRLINSLELCKKVQLANKGDFA